MNKREQDPLLDQALRQADACAREELDAIGADESLPLPDGPRLAALDQRVFPVERSQERRGGRIAWKEAVTVAVTAAACFGGVLALEASADAREAVSNFVIQNFGEYGLVQTVEGDALGKPFGWPHEYYPTWLPEGYFFSRMMLGDGMDALYYVNKEEKEISFFCYSLDISGYNTEDRVGEEIYIGNTKGYIFQGDSELSKIIVLYADEIIIISSEVDYLDAWNMAEMVNGLK